ncbi:hypothetical protein HanXRQr2_Chr10g0420201 [Helianthus annuus]|uniref:Uncharacterized protein n=1 Tax=Helianthus annuus TaxID=4232 RepID=A0A251TG35_HELAN|nr:hypothetical protein HanXRQr2_Chr10g0420201 [Helianthus annuus]
MDKDDDCGYRGGGHSVVACRWRFNHNDSRLVLPPFTLYHTSASPPFTAPSCWHLGGDML